MATGETLEGDEIAPSTGLADGLPFAGAAADSAALRRARARSVLLAVALLAVAAVLGISVKAAPAGHPWFQAFDDRWRRLVVDHRVGWLTVVARVLSVVGSAYVTLPLRVVIAGVLAARRRWVQFAAFVTAIVVSEVLVGQVKALVGRQRPPAGLVHATGTSFPSGHAIAAAVTAFGIVIAFLPRGRRRWHWIVAATAIAATMSWSRTYLSVHWATDTIAGTSIGIACALLAEAVFESGRSVVAEAAAEMPDPSRPGAGASAHPERDRHADGAR
jgi:undecaprenyl-diphosphatase